MASIGKKTESLVWTDDEVELLLRVTLEYKSQKYQENGVLPREIFRDIVGISTTISNGRHGCRQGFPSPAGKHLASTTNTGMLWTPGIGMATDGLCSSISNYVKTSRVDRWEPPASLWELKLQTQRNPRRLLACFPHLPVIRPRLMPTWTPVKSASTPLTALTVLPLQSYAIDAICSR